MAAEYLPHPGLVDYHTCDNGRRIFYSPAAWNTIPVIMAAEYFPHPGRVEFLQLLDPQIDLHIKILLLLFRLEKNSFRTDGVLHR